MTEASHSARVLLHPTANRRVVEGETLRNAMAVSARWRAVTAHKVQASSVPKGRLDHLKSGPDGPTRPSSKRWVYTALVAVALIGVGLTLRHANQTYSPGASAQALSLPASRDVAGLVHRETGDEVAAATTRVVITNHSALTPQAIEASVVAPEPAPLATGDAPPVKAWVPHTKAAVPAASASVKSQAVILPVSGKASVATSAPISKSDTNTLGLPPGEPVRERAFTSDAPAAASVPGVAKQTQSNQLLQFRALPQQPSSSPAAARSVALGSAPGEPPRARALGVPVDGMVTVELDGAVRVYRVGQTLPNGQIVISADASSGKFVLGPPSGTGQ
jgi:hypothetical protein